MRDDDGGVIHITLAIASFMQILIEAVFWVGARFAGYAAIVVLAIGLPVFLVRLVRRRR